jgi:hypothetical protein
MEKGSTGDGLLTEPSVRVHWVDGWLSFLPERLSLRPLGPPLAGGRTFLQSCLFRRYSLGDRPIRLRNTLEK